MHVFLLMILEKHVRSISKKKKIIYDFDEISLLYIIY
jgi:hypothetical protein